MKGMKLFAWFLFILCTHALSSLALPSFSTLEYQGHLANISRPLVRGQEIHVRKLHTGGDGTVKMHGEKHEIDDSSKNQRGKSGASGGANIDHRRRDEKSSAPSLLGRLPFDLITKTILQVTLAFILPLGLL